MITINTKIDIIPKGVMPVIHLSQYDSDFTLTFTIYSSEGTLTLPSGTTAMIRGTKSDGNGYDADCTISDNVVTVTGDVQMTAAAGINIYEIVLTKSDKELCTMNFVLDVERAAMDIDTITSESVLKEIDAVIASVGDAEAAASAAEAAAEAAATFTTDTTLSIAGKAADAKETGDMFSAVAAIIPAIDTTLSAAGKAADAKATGDGLAAVTAAIPAIDNTLSVANKAADAKTTGDSINEVKTELYRAFPINTKIGSIVSFDDAAETIPIKDIITDDITPIQDLNGYTSAWCGGAGKNKFAGFETGSTTTSGVEFEFNDAFVSITGRTESTNVNSPEKTIVDGGTAAPVTIPANQPITISISGTYSAPTMELDLIDSGSTVITTLSSSTAVWTYTPTVEITIAALKFRITANNTAVNIEGNLQIEYGSSKTSWEPYSNICPITRVTKLSFSRTGKNLIDSDFLLQANGWTKDAYGQYSGPLNQLRMAFNYNLTGGVPEFRNLQITDRITVSFEAYGSIVPANSSAYVYLYYTDGTNSMVSVKANEWTQYSLTSTAGKTVCALAFSYGNNQTCYIRNFQIEKGTTATPYEPYQGTYDTVDWSNVDIGEGLKPYGGILNALTGEFTVTKVGREFDGTETWEKMPYTYPAYRVTYNNMETDANNNQRACSHYPNVVVGSGTSYEGYYAFTTGTSPNNVLVQFRPDLSVYTNLTAWKTFLTDQKTAGTPVTAWWELDPDYYITLHLTPIQVQALLNNYVYASVVYGIKVIYRADPNKYIEERLNAVKNIIAGVELSTTATKNYVTGDFVIIGDDLYKVTANVASGETLTIGTNITASTVAEQLKALYAAI